MVRALPERQRDQREQHDAADRMRREPVRALEGERAVGDEPERRARAPTIEQPAGEQQRADQDALAEEQPDDRLEAQQQVPHQNSPPARIDASTSVTPIHAA